MPWYQNTLDRRTTDWLCRVLLVKMGQQPVVCRVCLSVCLSVCLPAYLTACLPAVCHCNGLRVVEERRSKE